MKHTSLLHDAERWTKNAARTVWKNMTYDNALKAVTVAAAVPVMAAGAGAVGAGIAAGSATQVLGGLATGLSAASTVAPSLAPTATAASHLSGTVSAASGGMARARERQTGQAQFPGRSAVVFTLLNLGAYMIYGGLMMMLNNIVISAGGENPDYTAFKLGISILLPGVAAIAGMVRLWSYWTRGESCLSTHNLFVKVYSGINVLWNGCVSLVMAAALCSLPIL